MMKILLIAMALVLVFPLIAIGAPYLVCDPQAGVTFYSLTGPPWCPSRVGAQPDGSIKMDLATADVGVNNLTVRACTTDPLWGELCSDPVPFAFTKPGPAAPPANIKLSK